MTFFFSIQTWDLVEAGWAAFTTTFKPADAKSSGSEVAKATPTTSGTKENVWRPASTIHTWPGVTPSLSIVGLGPEAVFLVRLGTSSFSGRNKVLCSFPI